MRQTTQKTMQVAAIDRFGGIETITPQTLPVPEVGPDEVLIRVESAGVAVWDPFDAKGGSPRCSESSRSSPTCSAPMVRARSRRSASRSAASRKATGCTPPPSRTRRAGSTPSTPQ